MLFFACAVVAAPKPVGADPGLPAPRNGDVRRSERDEPTTIDEPAGGAALHTEVVGFDLSGPKVFERLAIDDLDTVLTPPGARLIPLHRLLDAFQVEKHETGATVSFASAGNVTVIVDVVKKEIRIGDTTESIESVTGVSDITLKDEIYLDPAVVGKSLGIQIEWDEPGYRFVAKTDRQLDVWKGFGASLLGVKTTRAAMNLPELFPAAWPHGLSVDFVQFELSPYLSTSGSASPLQSATLAIDAPRETLWGSAFGGRYRLQMAEPWAARSSAGVRAAITSPIVVSHLEWSASFHDTDVSVGDAVFGVNDLTFPILRMTGVRFNGLSGVRGAKGQHGTPSGMGKSFARSQVFEGAAPAGSRVELIVNGRSIETQVVLVGTYRFEEVRLAPGVLNSVQIVITEASGVQRVIEKNMFGKSVQLPKGGLAHLGGLGTNRREQDWTALGVLGAERILYGLTDSLTVGTTWAAQAGTLRSAATDPSSTGLRPYPTSSVHKGAQVAWLPSEHAQLSGDISFSNGSGNQGASDGRAYKVKAELYPTHDTQIRSQWFAYSPWFFNGQNLTLRDREGYAFGANWNINRHWRASSAGASIRNDLDGRADAPLHLSFQNLEITSSPNPRLTVTGGATRLSLNLGDRAPATLYTMKVQATPFSNADLEATVSRGRYPDSVNVSDFLSGLSFDGFSTYQPAAVAATFRVAVRPGHTLGATYWDGQGKKRTSIVDSFSLKGTSIRLFTELGYDANYQKAFFEHRADYRFDRAGKNRIGVDVRHEMGKWTSLVTVTFSELFSQGRGAPVLLSDSTVTPDRGAIRGRVFVDANADGRLDPDEPGVNAVRVVMDDGTRVLTDRNGYFVFAGSGETAKHRVFLDVDTVPAIYSPTHAIQTAVIRSGNVTEVNFGVSPLNSVSGAVEAMNPLQGAQPMPGVRVYLTRAADDKELGDSVTDQQGKYYLADLRPGQYYVRVDAETLSPGSTVAEPIMKVEIHPAKEPQELSLAPFLADPPREATIERLVRDRPSQVVGR